MRTYLSLEELALRDNPSISIAGGVMTVLGTPGNDVVLISPGADAHHATAYYSGADGFQVVQFDPTTIQQVNADLGAGDDYYVDNLICGLNTTAIFGETVMMGAGNDYVFGGGCNVNGVISQLMGGDGSDIINSNNHVDQGFAGLTIMDGGAGTDTVVCDNGPDWVFGAENVFAFGASDKLFR